MMLGQGLIHNIIQRSTGKVALAGVVLFLVFTAIVLPNQAAQSEDYTGDAGSPDQSFFYTPEDLYRMAEAYGPGGRQAYITARFTFDLVWPLVYLIFLGTSLGWLCGKLFEPYSRWRSWVSLPLLGALFDYLENIAAAIVMARYPGSSPVAAAAAPIFTVLKWSMIGFSFLVVLVLLSRVILVGLRRAPQEPT
jgi:hypothetical protein